MSLYPPGSPDSGSLPFAGSAESHVPRGILASIEGLCCCAVPPSSSLPFLFEIEAPSTAFRFSGTRAMSPTYCSAAWFVFCLLEIGRHLCDPLSHSDLPKFRKSEQTKTTHEKNWMMEHNSWKIITSKLHVQICTYLTTTKFYIQIKRAKISRNITKSKYLRKMHSYPLHDLPVINVFNLQQFLSRHSLSILIQQIKTTLEDLSRSLRNFLTSWFTIFQTVTIVHFEYHTHLLCCLINLVLFSVG